MPQKRRLQTRHSVELAATLTIDDDSLEGEFRNLSLGGAFLAAPMGGRTVTTGTRGQVSFRIPTQDEPISVGASVRWSSEDGVGLQFDGLRAREVWSLNRYFEQVAS